MAYSDEGEIRQDSQLPQGLIVWLLGSNEKMKLLKASKKSATPTALIASCPIQLAWAQVLNITPPTCGGGGCQNQYTYVTIGPLLTSAWDQGCGFNDLTPPHVLIPHIVTDAPLVVSP